VSDSAEVINCILWENGPDQLDGTTPHVSYSDIQNGWPGTANIDADPLFVIGSDGYHYLSQIAAGQVETSPCVDTGSDLASNLGMDDYWTRTDEVPDSGMVNMGFHYGTFSSSWRVPFYPSAYAISEITGGTVDLFLWAGDSNGLRNYLICGGVSGTDPGTPLPGGLATLPINWDVFTTLVLGRVNGPIFADFLGTLDADGVATASLNLPAFPGSAGLTMYYAYVLNGPWDFASNPVSIKIVP
jgi:hypothetical protein